MLSSNPSERFKITATLPKMSSLLICHLINLQFNFTQDQFKMPSNRFRAKCNACFSLHSGPLPSLILSARTSQTRVHKIPLQSLAWPCFLPSYRTFHHMAYMFIVYHPNICFPPWAKELCFAHCHLHTDWHSTGQHSRSTGEFEWMNEWKDYKVNACLWRFILKIKFEIYRLKIARFNTTKCASFPCLNDFIFVPVVVPNLSSWKCGVIWSVGFYLLSEFLFSLHVYSLPLPTKRMQFLLYQLISAHMFQWKKNLLQVFIIK